ncbi:MAG TPA: ferritin-like domain-containing protein [Candidatus Margulisiibacteriota bacterium]|nr:ferritin-like domain-containing protein [Candidatus Margulisiibacteriota bacterium]
MRTRELLNLRNSGHSGINALFAKAHSADWDIERDVDWATPVAPDDPLVDHAWGAFSQTPTFQGLPEAVKTRVTRRGLGRILNILQVGESVAQDVCAKIALRVREEDYRNHAVAQAMDEARHHLAYRRLLEKMNDELEDIDVGTEMMFDSLLASDDPLTLIATEQFFLESLAMGIFEGIQRHARHPLLREIISLVTRDESRHMGFGVLYVAEWMRGHNLDQQIAFARRWLGQILAVVLDQPGPLMLSRVVQRMRDAGVDNADQLGAQMLREQRDVNAAEAADAVAGRRVPHLLKSARRAGLLKQEILEALGIRTHPLILGVLRQPGDADAPA